MTSGPPRAHVIYVFFFAAAVQKHRVLVFRALGCEELSLGRVKKKRRVLRGLKFRKGPGTENMTC